eukprot:6187469-Amphidinium_carterae.1
MTARSSGCVGGLPRFNVAKHTPWVYLLDLETCAGVSWGAVLSTQHPATGTDAEKVQINSAPERLQLEPHLILLQVPSFGGSDHDPGQLTIQKATMGKHQRQPRRRWKWSIKKADWDRYSTKDRGCNQAGTPSHAHLVKTVRATTAHAIPRGRSRRLCKGWWNDELEALQKERMQVSDLLSRVGGEDNGPAEAQKVPLRLKLHALRTSFREAVRAAGTSLAKS